MQLGDAHKLPKKLIRQLLLKRSISHIAATVPTGKKQDISILKNLDYMLIPNPFELSLP